jgi:hypothetical protein
MRTIHQQALIMLLDPSGCITRCTAGQFSCFVASLLV